MDLPIFAVIPEIKDRLRQEDTLIIEAPPGAGKTTIVPLQLLNEQWAHRKIIVLEPRRMAARAVAHRMSELLAEPVGKTVGYKIRQEQRISKHTRIEVITGGVLLRMLQDDPAMEHYSAIIFDEFHERSMDADFALSLSLYSRQIFRDQESPLKLLLMSATLNGDQLAEFLNAPRVQSKGRSFPVDVRYLGECDHRNWVENICRTVLTAQQNHEGNILVFLPGKKEIIQVQKQLANTLPRDIAILPLYGALGLPEQIKAIEPIAPNSAFKRKVVLATDIAETSLTIEAVTVVIDCCLHRTPVFDSRSGITRLKTQKISRASAIQRSGRAGRLAPGICYRLISESTTLSPFATVEMTQADLTHLILQMLNYGISNPDELSWLTRPPEKAYGNAVALLKLLGAVTEVNKNLTLTEHGERLTQLNVHPRWAHMIILANKLGLGSEAAFLSACCIETGRPHSINNNIESWLNWLSRPPTASTKEEKTWLQKVERQHRDFCQLIELNQPSHPLPKSACGVLLAFAYPDRIARLRDGSNTTYLLSNGRAATLPENSELFGKEWLVASEVGGVNGQSHDRIFLAAQLLEDDIVNHLENLIKTKKDIRWDHNEGRIVAEELQCIGEICFRRKPLKEHSSVTRSHIIINHIRTSQLRALPWTELSSQLCHRINTLRSSLPDLHKHLPDCSTENLMSQLEHWLGPYIQNVTTAKDIQRLDLVAILNTFIGWSNLSTIEQMAPPQFTAPTGNLVKIDYSQTPPAVKIKLQEMFGCATTPTIANGKIPLSVHLLSPANRPLQITQDLASFWQNSYKDVQKEMKGRYPKHPWPDDPTTATPTRYTKRRSGQQ